MLTDKTKEVRHAPSPAKVGTLIRSRGAGLQPKILRIESFEAEPAETAHALGKGLKKDFESRGARAPVGSDRYPWTSVRKSGALATCAPGDSSASRDASIYRDKPGEPGNFPGMPAREVHRSGPTGIGRTVCTLGLAPRVRQPRGDLCVSVAGSTPAPGSAPSARTGARTNRVVPSGGAIGTSWSSSVVELRVAGSIPAFTARELTYPVSKRGDNSVTESGRVSPVRDRVVLAGAAPGGPVFDTRQDATHKGEGSRHAGPSRADHSREARGPRGPAPSSMSTSVEGHLGLGRLGSSPPRTSGVMRAVESGDFPVSSRRDVTAGETALFLRRCA